MVLAKQFDNTEAIIPFNSSFKFALNIFELINDPVYSHVLWIKGAPERVWQKCGHIYMDNQTVPIDDSI